MHSVASLLASGLEQNSKNGKDCSNRKSSRSKRAGVKVARREGLLQLEVREKQAGWSKSNVMGRIAPIGQQREASKRVKTGRKAPTGSQREASGLEQKE